MPLKNPSRDALPTLGVFLAAFLGYAATCYPGLGGGDSGELATAAFTMGVPHPTGYPLYMLIARTWIWLYPVGEVALRLNILSALVTAGAAAVLFHLHRSLGRGLPVAAVAALLFAFSPNIWAQGISFEVYGFELLLGAAFLLACLRWSDTADRRWLLLAALLAGVQLTHHLTSVFAVAAGGLTLVGALRREDRVEITWKAALLAGLPLTLYAYLLVRSLANPPVDWGNPETFQTLLWHATGRQYDSKIFPLRWPEIAANARFLGGLLLDNFPFLLALPALAGVALLSVRRRPFGFSVAALALGQGAFCLIYRVKDLDAFTPPLLLALNLGLGAFADEALRMARLESRPRARVVAAAAAAVLLVWFGVVTARESAPGTTFFASSYAADLLDTIPYGAEFRPVGDPLVNALLYAQVVEQRRTDVRVRLNGTAVFQGYREGADPRRPVFFLKDESLTDLPASLAEPYGEIFQMRTPGSTPAPGPAGIARPIPGEEELRALGTRDAMAQYILAKRLFERWEREQAAGNIPAAKAMAGAVLEESTRFIARIVPREDEIEHMLGLVVSLGRWDEVILWGERLAALRQLDAPLANNLAWAYLQTASRLDRAEELSRRAVSVEPANAQFLDTQAMVLLARGKREEAARAVERARALAPDDEGIRADAEKILGKAGR